MKKIVSLLCVSLCLISAKAQEQDSARIINDLEAKYDVLHERQKHLVEEIDRLQEESTNTRQQFLQLQSEATARQHQLDSLRSELKRSTRKQSITNDTLEERIAQVQAEQMRHQCQLDTLRFQSQRLTEIQMADRDSLTTEIQKTNASVQANDDRLSRRTLWIVLVGIILFVVLLVGLYFLQRRIKRGTTSIDEVRKAQDALQTAQSKLQEESLSLDNKLLALAEKQISAVPQSPLEGDQTPDHSLVLKVADEVTRIEMNLSRMDPSVRGHKQLSKAVERIKNNFLANGYEMVEMLGKPYHEGMNVIANFVLDENLKEGEQIITGIIKPQINYKGKLIQAAQITVSQNI